MAVSRHNVAIPESKWTEIERILRVLPFLAQTPSAFVLRAVENEIERVWREFKLTPEGRPRFVASVASARRGPAATG